MNQRDTVQALMNAIEQEEWAQAASYLTDDFVFSGAVPQPIGSAEWLGIHKAFAAAYSDFRLNYQFGAEEGERVHCTVQLSGKQTSELRIPMPGVPVVPATGKTVSLPREAITVTFRAGKIADFHVDPVEGGGLPGMLKQLGAVPAGH